MKSADIHTGLKYVNSLGYEITVLDVLPFGQILLGTQENTIQWEKPKARVLEEINLGLRARPQPDRPYGQRREEMRL